MSNGNYNPSSLTDIGLYMLWFGANHAKVTVNQDPDYEWHVFVETIDGYAYMKDFTGMMLSKALKQACEFCLGARAYKLKLKQEINSG
jgi:hypothetical protein